MIPPNIKSLILDMDGVLWRGDAPIGDLPRIFARIASRGLAVAFATNNGTRTPEQYAARLASFGVQVEPWQVVTSALAVAELLDRAIPPFPVSEMGGPRGVARPVFAIGEAGVMNALRDKGFEPLPVERAAEAQAVVMGIDRQINFEKMAAAALLVRRGLPFFATNSDKTFPTPRGEIPGAGAWVAVIVTATGVEPIYAGKPAPYLLELARQRLGTPKEETLVVGDRLETDIAGGQAAGMPAALVLSGVSTREQGEAWRPRIDVMAEDLGELVE
ncbi:MAG: 4-nitrophenyl phosphatase [Anaerolineaceae bacterium]|nr:MAG: 4-nitrophenyl phosphatase [Anaerolineaceae bacterium]